MSIAIGIALVWLALGLSGALVSVRLVRRVWTERAHTSATTKVFATVTVVLGTVGALGTSLGLMRMTGAVGGDGSDPSQQARILAEGISEAMNSTAFLLATWLPSLIATFVLMRRRERRAQ